MRHGFLKNFLCALTFSISPIYLPVNAAAPPDAGQIIQEIPKEEKLPIETTPLEIEDSKTEPLETGGEKILIESLIFKGNEAFSTDELMTEL